jgi:dienelactone hydrolase
VSGSLRAALAAAALLLAAAPGAAGGAEEVAARFARQFAEGAHAANLPLMDEKMRAAMGADAAEKLRLEIVAQQGAVQEVGAAWAEDVVQGYRRLRVPVRFANGTLDFRVVLDEAGAIAGFFLVPHSEPRSAAEETPPVPEVEVSIGEGERALPGTLTVPAGDGPFPGVVLVHGSGPNDRDETIGPNKPFRDLAWGLARRGIATLRYDKRTHARPADLVAIGGALTVREEVIDDARAALARLAAAARVDPRRVFLLGHSLGGTLAPRIAEGEPRPAGIVVLAGATLPLPEKIVAQTRHVAGLDGTVTVEERAQLEAIEAQARMLRAALSGAGPQPEGTILGAPIGYFRDLEAHDGPAAAARLALPILVLQGERDYQVTLEDHGRWRAALAGRPFACLATYPELDHLFRRGEGPSGPADYERRAPLDPRVLDDIAAWIRTAHCPGRVPTEPTGEALPKSGGKSGGS